ncbi:MAG: hypothetical protein QXT37_06675 [Thermofilaceae archaeon]
MSEIMTLEGKIREFREYLSKLELLRQEGKVTDEVYQELKNTYSRELKKYENKLEELRKRLAEEGETHVITTRQDSYTPAPPKPAHTIEHTLSDTTVITAKKTEAMPTLARVSVLWEHRVRIAKALDALASRLRWRVEAGGKSLTVERLKRLVFVNSIYQHPVITNVKDPTKYSLRGMKISREAMRTRIHSSSKPAMQHYTPSQLEGTKVYPSLHEKKVRTKTDYYWRKSKIEDYLEPASLSFIFFIVFSIVLLPIFFAVVYNPLIAFIIAIISIIAVIAGYRSGSS